MRQMRPRFEDMPPTQALHIYWDQRWDIDASSCEIIDRTPSGVMAFYF